MLDKVQRVKLILNPLKKPSEPALQTLIDRKPETNDGSASTTNIIPGYILDFEEHSEEYVSEISSRMEESLKVRQRSISGHSFSKSFDIKNKKLYKSLNYWAQNNPLLKAEEVIFESRGIWRNQYDFIMSCFSFGLGLGNIWRFPFMVLKNGHGAFIIAYLILLIFVGAPVLFLELCLSQFSSRSVVGIWNVAPSFVGIGYSMLIASVFYSFYYNLVLAWDFFYFINSLRIKIPFITCDNIWNDLNCYLNLNTSTNAQTASEQFWYRFITNIVDQYDNLINKIDDVPRKLIWYICSSMLLSWFFSCACLTRNVKLSGKRVYTLLALGYINMIVVLVIGFTLNHSKNGMMLLFAIDYKWLLKMSVWVDAAKQLSFSLGIGLGSIVSLGSYNLFTDKIDMTILLNCCNNFFCALMNTVSIYLIIGFFMSKYDLTSEQLINYANEGFLFIIYPESIASFKYPQIVGLIFFFIVFVVGLDSLLILITAIVGGLIEMFSGINQTKYHRICFILLLHIISGFLSLFFVTNTGYYWFTFLNRTAFSQNLLAIELAELLVVSYVYGIRCFARDYRMMQKRKICIVWKILIAYISPFILIVLLCGGFVTTTDNWTLCFNFKCTSFPLWNIILEFIVKILFILPIPGTFLYVLFLKAKSKNISLKLALKKINKSSLRWGPSKKSNWLQSEYYSRRLFYIKTLNTMYYEADIENDKERHKSWFARDIDLDLNESASLGSLDSDKQDSETSDYNIAPIPHLDDTNPIEDIIEFSSPNEMIYKVDKLETKTDKLVIKTTDKLVTKTTDQSKVLSKETDQTVTPSVISPKFTTSSSEILHLYINNKKKKIVNKKK